MSDLDSDGDSDIVCRWGFEKLVWYENTGINLNIQSSKNFPENFLLKQNYPNPFNPETNIIYNLPVPGKVILTVYNMQGIKIEELVMEHQKVGNHNYKWNIENKSIASGVYFIHLSFLGNNGKKYQTTIKTVVLK